MSSHKGSIKIDPKKGSIGGLVLGEPIAKILAYIQLNIQLYGRIEIISTKEDAKNPIFICLPDSGIPYPF
jgi:hypothetical protein